MKTFTITLASSMLLFFSCQPKEEANQKEVATLVPPCTVERSDAIDRVDETLKYDSLGRLNLLVRSQFDKKEEIEFTYDRKGRLIQIFDKEGTEYEVYEYNDLGQIVRELIYDDTISLESLKEYELHEYDEKGFKIKTTYYQIDQEAKAKAVEIDFYTYNENGDLVEINTELLTENKKFKEASFEYTDIDSKVKYPLGYTSFTEKKLPSKKTIYSNNGTILHDIFLSYETNEAGFITKTYTVDQKYGAKGKPESKDTISVLTHKYTNCY